jgi:hypothetical protein
VVVMEARSDRNGGLVASREVPIVVK